MKVTLDENPLKLEGKSPSITMRPEDEADQHVLDTLTENYDVYFGRRVETKESVYVTITLKGITG